ncbi:hypothetical protein ACJ73_02167 [Blastomyces percursus]|uniref:Uncharacterized protein n=1 Tax=Blastomyces percursus TaxID=1658174 RepID=A0A1J9REL4_9EURO|nr:hypothetical protein ACJ73_02167 [Blastomyces percursus]
MTRCPEILIISAADVPPGAKEFNQSSSQHWIALLLLLLKASNFYKRLRRALENKTFPVTPSRGQFNLHEAKVREQLHANPKDDDDQPLSFGRGDVGELEVAHIIPHSIMSTKFVDGELQLSESKKTALSVLSLTQIYFEAMDSLNHPQNTYTIQSSSQVLSQLYNLPVARTLLLSPNLTIDPPSAKLLAIHHAIAIIIALSAAGEHVDQILHDMEEVRSDGSAEVRRIISLKIGGWLGSVVA